MHVFDDRVCDVGWIVPQCPTCFFRPRGFRVEFYISVEHILTYVSSHCHYIQTNHARPSHLVKNQHNSRNMKGEALLCPSQISRCVFSHKKKHPQAMASPCGAMRGFRWCFTRAIRHHGPTSTGAFSTPNGDGGGLLSPPWSTRWMLFE